MKPILKIILALALLTCCLTANLPAAGKLEAGKDRVDTPAISDGLCVHNLFQSKMVFQRDRPLLVRGWATPGENVTVTFGGKTQSSTAAADRSCQVPGRVSTGPERELPARGDNVIRLPDEELSPVFRGQWSKNPLQRWACGISTKELTTPAVLRQAGCPAKRNENQPWSP